MKADIFYTTVLGRTFFRFLQKAGFLRLAAWFLHTPASKCMIPGYIKKYGIDMRPYKGQVYDSFASFFSRKRDDIPFVTDPHVLISPCDGYLSIYPVKKDLTIPMKGSAYTLTDLIPDQAAAEQFQGGLCLILRLEASDYHHFCFFDDGILKETHYIPGQLHSVQPIALRTAPVFRLNRRWWSIMETEHFGTVAQIEIGAVLVGGVSFSKEKGQSGSYTFCRGDEMGCFELAGSTIALFFDSSVRSRLVFRKALKPALYGKKEIRVKMGQETGRLKYEK